MPVIDRTFAQKSDFHAKDKLLRRKAVAENKEF